MKFIKYQIEILKKVIEEGTVLKDSPLLLEQKEMIIDFVCEINQEMEIETDKSKVGAIIDKIFADEIGIE